MRRFWAVVLTIVALFGIVVLAGLPLYVFPPVDPVRHSAAAFVLGPPMDDRLALAEHLRDEGLADRIIVSVQPSGGQTAADTALCGQSEVVCEVADPFTTSGEVMMIAEQEPASVIVVTSTPHVARTRYLFSKCYPGDVTVIATKQPPTSIAEWAYQYVYQSIAFVKAVFEPCIDAGADE